MKKLFTKNHLLILIMLFLSSSIMAQFTASGQVTDADGEGLIGVSIIVKGTAIGGTTDLNGNFSIEVPGESAVLLFSYTGFSSKEVEANSNSGNLNVQLTDTATELDAVVVTGLATNTKRSNLANSVASVSAKDLTGIAPNATAESQLYGKVPGLNLTSTSGAPGGGMSFRLRGITSISGSSQPLIVLDGIFIDNSSIAAGLNIVSRASGGGSQSNQDNPSNRLADIDPMDIETIEVLKGPSAAAIYGSRASGGVVIITTKRGDKGKTKIRVSQSLGWTEMLNPLGNREWTEERVLNSNFAADIDNYRAAVNSGTINDLEDQLYGQKGILSNTRLSFSGGNEKTTFYISGNWRDEEGIVKNTGYEKLSARLNLDHQVNDWLDLSLSSNYINASSDRGFFNNDNSGTTMGISFTSTPTWAQLEADENGNFPANPYAPSNFLETAEKVTNNETGNRLISGGRATAQLYTDDRNSLKFLFEGGMDYYTLSTTAIFPNDLQFQSNGNGLNGVSVQGNTVNLNTNLQAFLVYSYYAANDLSFRTQLGVTQANFNQNTILGEGTNLIGSQTNLNQSGTRNVTQTRFIQEDKGFFVQEEVNWDDKIIATVGLRADKSSNNSDVNELFYYPKANLAINLHEFEGFEIANLSQLKLRVAYGQSGNFPAFGSKYTSFASAILGGQPGVEIGQTLGNDDVGPERQEEIEFGIDIGLLNNRILFDATYYNRSVEDLLLNAAVPTSTGFLRQVTNAAALENKGVELGLSADIVRSSDLNWSARLNWWKNTGEVTKLLVPAFTTGGFADFLGNFMIKEGFSPTTIIGVGPNPTIVLNPGTDANGNEIFIDDDGDGIDDRASLQEFGNAEPDFQMSWVNNLSYKSFDLTFIWHWKQGGENINLSALLFDLNNTSPDYDKIDLDPDGVLGNGDYRLSQLGSNTGPYVEDAGYIRLREIGLYYTLPPSVLNEKGKLRVGFSGNNLINIFDYNSYDPEVSNFGGNGLSLGVEVTPFPSAKRYNFHVSLEF